MFNNYYLKQPVAGGLTFENSGVNSLSTVRIILQKCGIQLL